MQYMTAELTLATQWLPVAGLALIAIVFYWIARPVSVGEARRLLHGGAKVVDVRSPDEFATGAVKGAVNIPLGELAGRIHAVAPDKTTPVLVHCLSGGRSAVAKSTLRRLGYTQVHNLGSLSRAKRIVEG